MKISSVSKKVLASALSAAMVVAFAPAVALADVHTGDKVTVKFDTTGLELAAGNSGLADKEVKITAANTVNAGDIFAGHTYNIAGTSTAITAWGVDVDGNGTLDVTTTTGALDFSGNAGAIANGSVITLKPVIAADQIKINSIEVAQKADDGNGGADVAFTINVANTDTSNAIAANDLRVILKKGDTQISELTYAPGIAANDTDEDITFATLKTGANTVDGQFASSLFGIGTYTVEFKDMSSAGKGKVIGSKTFEVTDVTIGGGVFKYDKTGTKPEDAHYKTSQTIKAVVGEPVAEQLDNAGSVFVETATDGGLVAYNNKTDVKELVAYKGADGKIVVKRSGSAWAGVTTVDGKTLGITSGMSLTAVFEIAPHAALSLNGTTLEIAALNGEGEKAITGVKSGSMKVKVELAGPSVNVTKEVALSDFGIGNAASLYAFGDATIAGGAYTAKATLTYTENSTDVKQSVELGTASLMLTKVTYDATENGDCSTASRVFANYGTLNAYAIGTGAGVAASVKATKTDTIDKFCGWSLDGAKVVTSADKIAKDATDVTLKAVFHAKNEGYKPAYTYANKTLTLSTDKGAGYKIYWTDNTADLDSTGSVYTGISNTGAGTSKGTEYTGALAVVDPTGSTAKTYYVQVKGKNAAGEDDYSTLLTLESANTYATGIKTWIDAAYVAETSDSTKTAPKYYSTVLSTVAADAKATILAMGYATPKDYTKAVVAQQVAALQKVADYELAVIDSYVAGVKLADGTVLQATEAKAAEAKAEIAKVMADVAIVTGENDQVKTAGKYTATQLVGASQKNNITSQAAFIDAIQKAAKGLVDSAATIKAEDVAAAEAVIAQLKDPKTAAAGLEAYKALTDAQKALVSKADLAAAEEAVAAAELKAAQDDAAVSKARNASKTVKAGKNGKTAKKQSVTLKKITSASGAKVTYKKSSGSSKISVKSGKAYLAKGVKKGTYKATVKATCGTQTAKIKVTFKVK